jgi:hypothetical protein
VLQRSGSANAIDFIEVLDRASPPGAPRQQTLFVRLLRPGFALTPDNLLIDGGERIRTVGIVWCSTADALPPQAEPGLVDTVDDPPRTLVIRTDSSGDYSTYTLSILANSGSSNPPAGFDPVLSSIEFSFKVECRADFDCADRHECPSELRLEPEIDYLARDYQGFRRLMLDRLNLLVPGWTERSPADLGVVLVELLAFSADNLAYRQDAIATEAYLATARQRISVRRHARLVDYFMHEGSNARVFVHFDVTGQAVALARGTELLTRVPDLPPVIAPASLEFTRALSAGALVFETAHDAVLDERLNRLSFYSWGNEGCCLPKGTTAATLRGRLDMLKVGDILIFEELVSPTTFRPEDADHAHRFAVRLTGIELNTDPSGQLFDEPPVDGPVDVTLISWDAADALPFALCLSVTERPGLEVSVAMGNIVVADHGRTFSGEALGVVPEHVLEIASATTGCGCDEVEPVPVLPRFRPVLKQAPLSHGFDVAALLAVPVSADGAFWPASSLTVIDPRSAKPLISRLTGTLGAVVEPWTAQRDLLASLSGATDFVVEIDNAGDARLRFGDDEHGKRPDPGTAFSATYRVGNGIVGNVGSGAIAHIVSPTNGVFDALSNPMPAEGGAEPENIEAVRRDAPEAFRTQERAVTAADYAAAAERRPDIQRAAASFRWTGSWHTVFVTPDRFGGGDVDAALKARLRRHLERFRMAGYDLDVTAPRYVPLDIGLHICVADNYFRADVLHAVEVALSSGVTSDGTLGLFHPDNFTFGQPAYLSPVIATAQAVEGVEAVRVDRFQRLVSPDPTSLDLGVIDIGALEIAQLANNPNFRERGRLEILAGGGK